MSSVERYKFTYEDSQHCTGFNMSNGTRLLPLEGVEFVLASAYDAQAAELERVKGQLSSAESDIREYEDAVIDNGKVIFEQATKLDAAEQECARVGGLLEEALAIANEPDGVDLRVRLTRFINWKRQTAATLKDIERGRG